MGDLVLRKERQGDIRNKSDVLPNKDVVQTCEGPSTPCVTADESWAIRVALAGGMGARRLRLGCEGEESKTRKMKVVDEH